MSELVQVYSDLSIEGALVLSRDETDFPINPRVGTIIVKNQCLYAYIKIGGLETWYPFASKTHSFVHVQGMASLHWVVNHGLGTKNLWIQVKDATGNIISVGKSDIDDNTFSLNFTQAIVGTVLVVAPDSVDVPEVMASVVNVANSAVLIDSSGVRINGSYALTSANITQQITDAVAPKANSIDVYSKTEADTLLDVKSNLGHGHAVSDVSGLQLALDAKLNASAKAMNASSADSVAYTGIIGKPTTIAGAGITDVYTKTETDTRIEAIIGAAPGALDTLAEIAAQLQGDESIVASLTNVVSNKPDFSYVDAQLALKSSIIHTHNGADVTGLQADLDAKANIADLGSVAAKDVAIAGDAGLTQVVLGNDSRLSDARTPIAHTHTAASVTDFSASVRALLSGLTWADFA